jgi:hypothetical protein
LTSPASSRFRSWLVDPHNPLTTNCLLWTVLQIIVKSERAKSEVRTTSHLEATMEQAASTKHDGEPNPLDSTGLCLLSFDGGGVRGLSTLYILKSIMDRLNHVRGESKLPPVKPCKVFDLIGGTSTGG